METWHDTLDGWCLLEDYYGCSNHCYSYYYYTGTTEIQVKGKLFSYYHTTSQEEKNKIQKRADRAVKIAKLAYKIGRAMKFSNTFPT